MHGQPIPGRAVVDGVVTVGTAVAALPDQPAFDVVLQADPDNTNPIFVGDGTPVVQLNPGETISFILENLNHISATVDTGSEALNWLVTIR